MSQLWQQTGPLAYLILPFGALAVLAALGYLRSTRRDALALALGASATTLLLGVLAFVTGTHRSIDALARLADASPSLVLYGAGESMSCLILSLVFAIVTSILLTAGSVRAQRTARRADGRLPGTLATHP